jgi:TrkA-N domain/RyR domain
MWYLHGGVGREGPSTTGRTTPAADRGSAELAARPGPLRRIADSWRRVELPVIIALGGIAAVLGFVGFRDLGFSITDSIHRTLQLFVIENIPHRGVPFVLDIARFLAPLVFGYTAVRAFVALFRSQVGIVALRFKHNHVVIAGLSDKGFALAKSLRDAAMGVAVIEADERVEAISGCRQRGIPVVIGDATDPATLAHARVGHARSLIAMLGDDGLNLDAAFSTTALLTDRRDRRLTAFVHLGDLSLWRLLSARGIASGHASRLRLEFFNVDEMAARLLLEAHPPFASLPADGSDEPRIGVVGIEGLGESLVVNAGRLWRNARTRKTDRLHISLMGADADVECRRLADQYPGLTSVCALDPYNIDPVWTDSAHWERELGPAAHERFYVCLPDEKAGLAASLALLGATRGAVPVVLAVRDERVGAAAMLSEGEFPNLHPFGVLSTTLTPEIFVRSVNEALAKATHEHYVGTERAREPALATNPSVVDWDDLPDALRESNRSFADAIGEKLDIVGFALVPAPLADPNRPPLAFTEGQIDELAPLEHLRWMRDLQDQGWRPGPEKDPERLRHPNLVGWDELPERDRDKDREAVRAIPAILARAGFEIVQVGDEAPPRADHRQADLPG